MRYADLAKYSLVSPILLKVAVETMLEGWAVSSWWQAIPWPFLTPFCYGLLAAFLINDVLSPLSSVRRLYRKWSEPLRSFQVVVNDAYDPHRSTLVALLSYRRRPSHSSVRFSVISTVGPQEVEKRFIFTQSVGLDGADVSERIVLGSVMIAHEGWTPRASVWGMEIGPENLPPNAPSIVRGQRVIVVVEVDGSEYRALVQRTNSPMWGGDGFHVVEPIDAMQLLGVV